MSRFAGILCAVIATLATSAVVTSAASATNFTASKYPTAASATSEAGNNVFSTEAGGVECKAELTIDALNAPSETATVTPSYTGCKAFGFLSATVSMEGCGYVFHSNGEIDVECPSGNAIKIVSSTCTAKVGTQTGLKSVSLANSGSGISAKANVTGVAYSVTKDGFACAFDGTGPKTGASFKHSSPVQFSATNKETVDIG